MLDLRIKGEMIADDILDTTVSVVKASSKKGALVNLRTKGKGVYK
jgi:hypothetical protein